MDKDRFQPRPNRLRHASLKLMQAAALALVVALAMPAKAADERAVKLKVPPSYPEIAKRMKITGVVKLTVTVDQEGKVTDVKVVSGNGMLSIAAEEAVRKWKFEPGPGTSTLEVALNFALGQ
ncbi:MAG: energy transducer TonB [Terracidiphilus sp.]|jgi:TonB family protein